MSERRTTGRITPRERLERKLIVSPSGCWEWRGAATGRGYGVISFHGRQQLAHRVMFVLVHGEIPDGLEVDHTCCNRGCVNPYHLEAVTHIENVRRWARTVTHCPQGHAYTPENTALEVGPRGTSRRCRRCHRDRQRIRAAQLRARYSSMRESASSCESGQR